MIAFARIAGPILALVFGSQALVFTLRDHLMAEIEERMQSEGQYSFANLDRAQSRQSFLIGGKRYYYAYSGRHRNLNFQAIEEVSAQYYHLNSEGKNVEVLVFLDEAGNFHTHLRGNSQPFAEDYSRLIAFSLVLMGLGLLLTLGGWGLGALIGVHHHADTDRARQV
jgi:hypothetical protein